MNPEAEQPELIRRAAAGDEDAFRCLVARVLPRLRRWALVRTGDRDDADEVVQRALIRLHRSLGRFEGRSRLSSWLYRILANAATDLERERAARGGPAWVAVSDGGAEEAGGGAGASPDPIRSLHADRMAAAVREFFETLPPRQREVLELVDHEGLRPQDVADALDLSPGTVRAHLFRARRAVRERILARYPELTEGYDA